MKPRIVILYGSAGGGHKSVAEALLEASTSLFGDKIDVSIVDVLTLAPPPFDKGAEAYSRIIKTPQFWKQLYDLGDSPRRAKWISSGASLYGRRAARSFIKTHPADLYVSVFHFALPLLDFLERKQVDVPYITVVTDLVTAPPIWFDERVDMCIVPTAGAKARALQSGLSSAQVKVMGLPIANKFTKPHPSKAKLREQLGWPKDLPMILLMAGGEGVGPLAEIATALELSDINMGAALVTGKNKRLKAKLEGMAWKKPTYIYGFSTEIDNFMHAADIIVTKAGPTSIVEAAACALPMIIYGRLPGQEDGNVEYVTDEGAGVWAPTPEEVVTSVRRWLKHPAQLRAAAQASRSIAHPKASRDIAKLLVTLAVDQARLNNSR